MIFGGSTAACTLRNSSKSYAREVIHIVGEAPKRAIVEAIIAFDYSDLEGVKILKDDPSVIAPVIGNNQVKRYLVDNGVLVDILFYERYIKMGYTDTQFTPSNMLIFGFTGVESRVEGIIQLPVTMGMEPQQVTQMLNFVVNKAGSTYNAIT